MKVNIWLNDYYNKYNSVPLDVYNHIEIDIFNNIIDSLSEDDLIILRGEPTIHPFLWQILNKLEGKNYILSTESAQSKSLVNYKKQIPYISFRYDGFSNDQIRGNRPLSLNMNEILREFSGRKTKFRIEYTISPFNLEFLETDILILNKMFNKYSEMKEPYFVIYQQSEIYNQHDYIWTPLSHNKIIELNKKSLLTKRTLTFLSSWLNKKNYNCISPQKEFVIDSFGKVRLCQSMRFHEVIGDLQKNNFKEIIEKTKEIRQGALECPMRNQCWLAYHCKDNANA